MEDLKKYIPPSSINHKRLGRLPELAEKYKDEKAIIFHQRAAFMWSCYLAGMDNFLANLVMEPKFCHELMDVVLEVNIEIAKRDLKAGADIIVLGDDYAHNCGTMMSPEHFYEFILPRFKKMVDIIHQEGGMVIKHSDGNIMGIIDLIIDTGIDGLNPIEPVAGMDIKYVKDKYGD